MPPTTLSADSYPRVDGSTSTSPLSVLISCKLLDVRCNWTDVTFTGERFITWETPQPALENLRILSSGTNQAYVNLIERMADIILVARQPSDDELALAGSRGVQLMVRPVALDAFVFVVNASNPVKSLTLRQIRAIYTGQMTNWKAMGGSDAPIQPYQREDNSGSQELMKSLVMKDLPMVAAPDMIILTMSGLINAVAVDTDGIGYSVYYYEQFIAPNENVRLCGVDGVLPDAETIRARAYPLTTEVYAAIRDDLDRESTAYWLWEWLLTEAGQAVVAESGYVPVR